MDNEMIESNVVDGGTLAVLTKAEIDQQITTAKTYPRSVTKFRTEANELVTIDESVAEECFYTIPRAGKSIQGPSSRLAEIVMSTWGNCRGGARIVAEEQSFIVAQGIFHDLERNVQVTMEVKRRITDKSGNRYGVDMIGVTGNAACSIAFRNAVFKGIPKAFWESIYKSAHQCAIGDIKTITVRRTAMLAHLSENNVTPEAVYNTLGIDGEADLGLQGLLVLRGVLNAIKEGDTSYEQAFSGTDTEQVSSKETEALNTAIKETKPTFSKNTSKKKAAAKKKPESNGNSAGPTKIDVKAKIKLIEAKLDKANNKKNCEELKTMSVECQDMAKDVLETLDLDDFNIIINGINDSIAQLEDGFGK